MMRDELRLTIAVCGLLLATGCALFRGKAGYRPLPEPAEPIVLGFYLASSDPVEGFSETVDEDGDPLYLAAEPFLTERDVWNATPYVNPERAMVRLDLTPDGAATLEQVTREHPGYRMAVFLNSDLVISPGWPAPIVAGTIFLYDGFSPERAQQIATQLNRQRVRRGPQFDQSEP